MRAAVLCAGALLAAPAAPPVQFRNEESLMTITIEHHEDVRFTAHAGEHRVTIDLPESHGGGDGGMTPPQLFVSALGACAGVYTADYCDSQGIDYRGMRITLDWEVRDRPRRIGSVRVRIEMPNDSVSTGQIEGIRRSVGDCLLHNTLAHRPDFLVEVATAPTTFPVRLAQVVGCESGACCRPPQ
jgi:uncharacterized OsmC-like protein